jgi:curved DNA-binding protein CbpA
MRNPGERGGEPKQMEVEHAESKRAGEYKGKTYYEILGVSQNATPDEIHKAFRELSRQSHPDRGGDLLYFQYLSEAYTVLKDAAKREQYDFKLVQVKQKRRPGKKIYIILKTDGSFETLEVDEDFEDQTGRWLTKIDRLTYKIDKIQKAINAYTKRANRETDKKYREEINEYVKSLEKLKEETEREKSAEWQKLHRHGGWA